MLVGSKTVCSLSCLQLDWLFSACGKSESLVLVKNLSKSLVIKLCVATFEFQISKNAQGAQI